jgi:hypothetical protein
MSKKVRKAIDSLREISPHLNDATTAANQVVERVEQFLNEECSIGIPCWILADKVKGDEGPAEQHIWLGYDRVNGKFRIAVEHLVQHGGRQDNLGPQPWASCPRDVKLTTLPKLPRLLEEIAEEAQKMAEKNDVAVAAVEEILGAMATEPKPDAD